VVRRVLTMLRIENGQELNPKVLKQGDALKRCAFNLF
jgi:hypothetical protein